MTSIGEKAAHVRSEAARNTTFDHHCHWPGCDRARESVLVEQRHRDAAAALHLEIIGSPHSESDLFEAEQLRAGEADNWPEVQAFARFDHDRTTALVEALDRARAALETVLHDDGYSELTQTTHDAVVFAIERLSAPKSEADREAVARACALVAQPHRDFTTNPLYPGDPAWQYADAILAALSRPGAC